MRFFKLNNIQLYLLLLLINVIIYYIFEEYILSSKIFFNSFSEQFNTNQINIFLSIQDKFFWVPMLFQILILTAKVNFTALIIYIGLYMQNYNINYKKILKISLYAESIFILYSVIRLFLIYKIGFNTLEQIQAYYPLSLYSFFSSKETKVWLLFPLYTMNIAQIIYWFILAMGITLILKTNYLKSLKIVMSSYGLGFLFWILIVVFAQVYFFPSTT